MVGWDKSSGNDPRLGRLAVHSLEQMDELLEGLYAITSTALIEGTLLSRVAPISTSAALPSPGRLTSLVFQTPNCGANFELFGKALTPEPHGHFVGFVYPAAGRIAQKQDMVSKIYRTNYGGKDADIRFTAADGQLGNVLWPQVGVKPFI